MVNICIFTLIQHPSYRLVTYCDMYDLYNCSYYIANLINRKIKVVNECWINLIFFKLKNAYLFIAA